jgi:Fe-S cluster assembly protein SufD
LQHYNEFVRESIEQYDKLPQESSELYKRHYINIPFDLKSFINNPESSDKVDFKVAIDDWFAKLGIKFDIALGSADFVIGSQNQFIKVESSEKVNDPFANELYKSSEDKYVAYINAYSDKTIIIEIPEGESASINMLIMNSNMPLNARIFVKVGKNAKLNVFEYYGSYSDKPTSLGIIHEITLETDAYLELNELHNENSNTLALSFCKNTSGDNSHLKLNSFYNGGTHTRVRNVIDANGKESEIDVQEVVFGSESQKFDINTIIVNNAPRTQASLESKAALMDSSFCILKGFAKILKGAEKSRSYVHERGILLDKGAKVYGLPDMAVDENDVKATHSSATSPVDPESVFYLMSKGIDDIGVKRLLIAGFFANSLSKMQNNLIKELSMSLINSKLEKKIYGEMPKMDSRNIWIGTTDSVDKDIFKGHYKYRGAE